MKTLKILLITLAAAAFLTLRPAGALACGGTLHMFMSEKAMDLVKNPELKAFIAKNRNAIMWNSWYPDSGYTSGNQYGEYSHWTPFFNGYIDYITTEMKPSDPDYDLAVSNLLGAMAHGLEDQLFDQVFLIKTEEVDGTGQAELDAGLDMICMKEHKRYLVTLPDEVITDNTKYTPVQHLVKVYERLGMNYNNIAEQIIRGQYTLAMALHGERIIFGFQEKIVRQKSPWGAKNYYTAPGGVLANARAVAAMWEAVWKRLHGHGGHYVIATIPEDGGSVISTDHRTVDSNFSVVFSMKYDNKTVTDKTVVVEDSTGARVPGSFNWGYNSNHFRFVPASDLKPKSTYKVILKKEIQNEFGDAMPADYTFTFKTP